MSMQCNICSTELGVPVYESDASLTSLCKVFPQPTRVRICPDCSHLQTDEIHDAASFYDTDYTILTESDEEDQIYEVKDGMKIYRTAHQTSVLVNKLHLESGTRILDYGCAKSSMMRLLLQNEPGIRPYLFDVSDRYVPFWEKFVPSEQWSIYDVPDDWNEYFDIVTSFFSLEHMTRPMEAVAQIVLLLKPGGRFYGIVPNVLTNSADLIVIDHVNHFTRTSLDRLLTSAGLVIDEIDAEVHRGAFVFSARRPMEADPASLSSAAADVVNVSSKLRELADYWTGAAGRVREVEQQIPDDSDFAIYGAGFYGAFIKSCLPQPRRIRCFVDQNPYLQGGNVDGVPIVTPEALPSDIRNVLVGLNPANARSIMAGVDAFKTRDLRYRYV